MHISKVLISAFILIIMPYAQAFSAEDTAQFTTDWFSNNIKTLDNYKKEFQNKDNIHCLEVGSWEGMSALYIADNYCNGNGSTLDAIDTWEGSLEHSKEEYSGLYERFLHNTTKYREANRIIPHRGFSKDKLFELIYEVRNNSRPKYDFIYIDGSHMAHNVLEDAILAWEILKIGGIIAFDDYEWKRNGYNNFDYRTPKIALDAFLATHETMYEILHKGYQIHLRKISDAPKNEDVVTVEQNNASVAATEEQKKQ